MNIEKSLWHADGNNIALSIPFTKVNKEKRTVSGFATLDNIDQTGDVVTAEASLKAFERFRGNLREMHQPISVGKVVSFKPETFYDPSTQKFYNGVYVDAYISKGAQDTWEKVLDGIFAGISLNSLVPAIYRDIIQSVLKTKSHTPRDCCISLAAAEFDDPLFIDNITQACSLAAWAVSTWSPAE